ncbi:hypothetical protein V1477_010107 [Vespula maculifrons]|uniref:Uncharacterized protein n=1 Tax=Vespula maculifrons TaxID=7453 RepID=A0ABD2CBP4_VESMC
MNLAHPKKSGKKIGDIDKGETKTCFRNNSVVTFQDGVRDSNIDERVIPRDRCVRRATMRSLRATPPVRYGSSNSLSMQNRTLPLVKGLRETECNRRANPSNDFSVASMNFAQSSWLYGCREPAACNVPIIQGLGYGNPNRCNRRYNLVEIISLLRLDEEAFKTKRVCASPASAEGEKSRPDKARKLLIYRGIRASSSLS